MDQNILDILTSCKLSNISLGSLMILAILIVLFSYHTFNHAVEIYMNSEIPGPFALPMIGNLFHLISLKEEDMFAFHQNLRMKYGDIYRLYFGTKQMIYVNNYELVREILIDKADIFDDRPDCYPGVSGHGILFSNGIKGKIFKGLAVSAINRRGGRKDSMETIMQQEVDSVIEYFKSTNGQGFSPKEIMTFLSTNIVNQTVFGFRYKYTDKYFSDVLKKLEAFMHILEPDTLGFFWGIAVNFKAATFGRKIMKHCYTQSKRKENAECDHESFLAKFYRKMDGTNLKLKRYFTDYEKFRCTADLFVAGSETTSSALRWLLLYMVQYPDIQEKCFQEIKNVIGDTDEKISPRHRTKLPYISATIMEVMRSAVIVAKLTPRVAKEDTYLQKHFVKKGSLVLVNIASVLTDKQYWKDADVFKPERFLDKEGNVQRCKRALFFSTGSRSCPGEILSSDLMFVCFSNLITNFIFKKENTNDKYDLGITARVSNSCRNYRLRAELREK